MNDKIPVASEKVVDGHEPLKRPVPQILVKEVLSDKFWNAMKRSFEATDK